MGRFPRCERSPRPDHAWHLLAAEKIFFIYVYPCFCDYLQDGFIFPFYFLAGGRGAKFFPTVLFRLRDCRHKNPFLFFAARHDKGSGRGRLGRFFKASRYPRGFFFSFFVLSTSFIYFHPLTNTIHNSQLAAIFLTLSYLVM